MENREPLDSNQLLSSEKTGAALAHVSGVFFPFFGPLVAFIVGSKSPYVRYHALHALIGMLLLNVFLIAIGVISLSISLYNLWQQYQENFKNFEWWPIILKSAVTWIILALIGLTNTVVNIIQGIRAYGGQLPKKSLTTAIVNRFVKRPQPAISPSQAS